MSDIDEYKNNFTVDLDKFLKDVLKEIAEYFGWVDEDSYSYLWGDDVELVKKGQQDHIAFRTPGATRGHIEVNEALIITDIKFYDTCEDVYTGDYESTLKEKYIGTKIEVK